VAANKKIPARAASHSPINAEWGVFQAASKCSYETGCGAGWHPARDPEGTPANRRAGRLPIGPQVTNLPHKSSEVLRPRFAIAFSDFPVHDYGLQLTLIQKAGAQCRFPF